MRVLRLIGDVAVWFLAVLGLVSVLSWAGARLGWVQPLVVVSGSMEPHIMTGDLLVALPEPTRDLRPGEVASIRSDLTGDLVTHRVVSVERTGAETWAVRMRGDANASPDAQAYVVGETVWQPAVRLPWAGYLVASLTRPVVALPLGVGIAALLGLSLLPRHAPRHQSPLAAGAGHDTTPAEVTS